MQHMPRPVANLSQPNARSSSNEFTHILVSKDKAPVYLNFCNDLTVVSIVKLFPFITEFLSLKPNQIYQKSNR